jgi:hypothetical protein
MAENIPQQAEQPSKRGKKKNYQSYGKDDRHRTSKTVGQATGMVLQVFSCTHTQCE